MIAACSAELFQQLHRRVVRITAAGMLALTVALAVFRLSTSSGEVASAVQQAEHDAAELTRATGEFTDSSFTYVEPRYLFASQFPHDLAGLLIGLALLAFVGGAILVGGDWRSRTVGATFSRRRSRSVAACARVVVWGSLGAAVAVGVALLSAGLLLAVAAVRGSASGFDLIGVLWMTLRGTLVVLVGGVLGATLGMLLRSEVVVLVLLLAYVLVVETLLPVLVLGFRTPAGQVHAFLRSEDLDRMSTFACDVPRCPDIALAGAGDGWAYLLIAGTLALCLLLAHRAARLPIWR